MIKKFIKNDIVIRASKTFAQAALGVLIAANITEGFSLTGFKVALVAALAAGASALWNYLLHLAHSKVKEV